MAKAPTIIETTRIGNQIKVTACDPETGTEVSAIAPATATRRELTELALNKLRYVLAKPK